MTQRQPQRRRRRNVPAASLPRPVSGAVEERSALPEQRPTTMAAHAATTARQSTRPREHHVQQDFSYVPKELVIVGAVSAISLGFIVVMSLIV
jgi:hypothetical protein